MILPYAAVCDGRWVQVGPKDLSQKAAGAKAAGAADFCDRLASLRQHPARSMQTAGPDILCRGRVEKLMK